MVGQDRDQLDPAARGLDNPDSFADRGARGNDIIDDQHITGQRCADDAAAFAVCS